MLSKFLQEISKYNISEYLQAQDQIRTKIQETMGSVKKPANSSTNSEFEKAREYLNKTGHRDNE